MDPKYSFGLKLLAAGAIFIALAYFGLDTSWVSSTILGSGAPTTVSAPVTP